LPRKRIPRDLTKARQLRASMTLPEVLLWNLLRKSPDRVRFRRQYSVDSYVIDFYCPLAKIGVEIDGIAHDMGDNPVRDVERDAKIAEFGIEIMRIPASDVLRLPEEIAEAVVRYCKR
jgi:very-short-patch-repair endonuclease